MAVAAIEQQTNYISADEIPELAAIREQVRREATEIMATRERVMLAEDEKPQPIHALTSANRVLQAQAEYGAESNEYAQAENGLFHDSLRMLGEWRRKNKDSYFRKIRHVWDEATEDFYADGYSTDSMTQAALLPSGFEEQDRRTINERVEDVTTKHAKALGSVVLGEAVHVRTISECADFAIEEHAQTQKSLWGYVPEIQKVMIRDFTYDEKTGDRFQEQVGLPGTYINHYVFQKALERSGFSAGHLDKTELHGTQLLTNDDLFDFVALLDQVASEEWCTNIFMGEVWPEEEPKDYQLVKQQAIEREQELHSHARMINDFVLDLARQGVKNEQAVVEVEEFVKQILITMSQDDIEITTDMFDIETAERLIMVTKLENLGQIEDARRLLMETIEAAPGGGYCGAGSCDLVRAEVAGEQAEKLKELGFDPKNTLLDKGDRNCKGCGKRTVAYELKKKQKGCTSCGVTAKY